MTQLKICSIFTTFADCYALHTKKATEEKSSFSNCGGGSETIEQQYLGILWRASENKKGQRCVSILNELAL